MKKRSLLLTVVATIGLTTTTMAQVPNYVPTNGLVGWWPFNGNTNDESGNGNNGAVNGATLSIDRYGISNKAYSLDGNNDYIQLGSSNFTSIDNLDNSDFSFSYWLKSTSAGIALMNFGWGFYSGLDINLKAYLNLITGSWPNNIWYLAESQDVQNDVWVNVTCVKQNNTISIFVNGSLHSIVIADNINPVGNQLYAGGNPIDNNNYVTGKIDDIGFWNRALTEQEITDLFNAVNCSNNTVITPQINSLNTGDNASFTATTSNPNPSYVWQSDFGLGFQTLTNVGNYSGVNSATLNISNVQLRNHNQPIRVISTSGNCIETSNVATISITDTCVNLITVTDTLIINTTLGIQPNLTTNTIKVFPNPANTHITIDYGNFSTMSGYSIKIINALSQEVFTSAINQQTSFIDLSSWSGDGIYFVQILDAQSNVIENRKIVLQ